MVIDLIAFARNFGSTAVVGAQALPLSWIPYVLNERVFLSDILHPPEKIYRKMMLRKILMEARRSKKAAHRVCARFEFLKIEAK